MVYTTLTHGFWVAKMITNKGKFNKLRTLASSDFKDDSSRLLLTNDAIDLAEEWLASKGLTHYYVNSGVSIDQTEKFKSELKKYVKDGLWRYRAEKRYGFIGTFLFAIIFAVTVQLVARWIIDNFFS